MRALVVGADGFAGRHLVRHLRESGDEVVEVVGPRYRHRAAGSARPMKLDIRDARGVSRVVSEAAPDVIYDLAGVSRQGERDDVPLAIGVSVAGAMNLLAAAASMSPRSRLVFASTGYVYRPGRARRTERSALAPTSVYAAAKLAAERALVAVGPATSVDVVIARPFNHIGPGQADGFVVPTVARQIAIASRRGSPDAVVRVEDPSVVRDFSDVRDVVVAYRLLGERGERMEAYNIASGRGTSIGELADVLAAEAGVSIRIQAAGPAPRRRGPPALIGDASRLQALGWEPRYTLPDTLKSVLAEAMASSR